MIKRKKVGHVYKLISKARKHPEILFNYGFNYYEDDDQEVKVFACPIILSQENPLFIQCVRFLENCYEEATSDERKTDFKDFEFKLVLQENQQNAWKLVLNDDLIKEFSQAQLCVAIDKKVEGGTFLFINSPIQNAYYNAQTIRECAGDVLNKLLEDKIVYERRYLYSPRG